MTLSSFFCRVATVRRIRNSPSSYEHFRAEIETCGDSVLDSYSRVFRNFAYLFCSQVIASIDNFVCREIKMRENSMKIRNQFSEKKEKGKCHQSRYESRFNWYKKTTSCLVWSSLLLWKKADPCVQSTNLSVDWLNFNEHYKSYIGKKKIELSISIKTQSLLI